MTTRAAKEALKEELDKMDETEHSQVFEIVQKYTQEYTKTQSGILVSSAILSEKCISEIQAYVNFCLDQKKRIDEDAKTRKAYENFVSQ
jgi:hypothetical protein